MSMQTSRRTKDQKGSVPFSPCLGGRTDNREMFVVPAEAGIQRLKSLGPGQIHAGITIKWDSTDSEPFNYKLLQDVLQCHIKRHVNRDTSRFFRNHYRQGGSEFFH